ncbi:hypothetical protein GCM10010116_59010 [Microbispora rosea subsp. aerata]|nr:hypothetical protein [Microbispora rosea]GGO29441.1 hypothetical protein GCM10010116_59010 [Microbispora rosea subsp. aerata]GIH58911.1 hypothetical protein Mro02_58250 [Microbispora rosea subsp. aerata]GLJ85902.1 hypothetical protein GCM10017588_46350 [Microbispora rosea subsp. aerata]
MPTRHALFREVPIAGVPDGDAVLVDAAAGCRDGEETAPHAGPLRAGLVYDLRRGGVDYTLMGGQIADIRRRPEQLKQEIVHGRVTVCPG